MASSSDFDLRSLVETAARAHRQDLDHRRDVDVRLGVAGGPVSHLCQDGVFQLRGLRQPLRFPPLDAPGDLWVPDIDPGAALEAHHADKAADLRSAERQGLTLVS